MAGGPGARPMGITIIAIVALIAGILGVFGSLALIGLGGLVAAVGVVGGGGLVFLWGLVVLALSIADLALAYGFWTVKPWGWRLGVVLALVNVVWSVLSLVLVRFDLSSLLISVVVAAIWIYYLNLPAIRSAFAAPASGLPVVGNALDPYLSKIRS